MSFISVMKAIGNGFKKGLGWAVTYIVPVGSLVALLFPQAKAVTAGATAAVNLIQKAVVMVEQKYAASGAATGTGQQKLAEVLELTEEAVIQLLKERGIEADTTYVQNLVNAVVAILNASPATDVK